MTVETREEAQRLGDKLLRRMKGNGWTLRVWEAAGWHFAVYNGPLGVYPTWGGDQYRCILHEVHEDGTLRIDGEHWTAYRRHKDPNEAFQTELRAARALAHRLQSMLIEIEAKLDQVSFG